MVQSRSGAVPRPTLERDYELAVAAARLAMAHPERTRVRCAMRRPRRVPADQGRGIATRAAPCARAMP